MIKIILCEDNHQQRKQIESIINEELETQDMSIALSTDDPHTIIKYVESAKEDTFIYFLDIDLQSDINGIELAKMIRKYDPRGYIIFLTSHTELTLLTFQYKVQALDYIIKADRETVATRIKECLNEVLNNLKYTKIKDTNMIPIDIGNNIVFFDLNEILFFETSSKEHKIRVHTCNGQSEFYGALKDVEKQVSSSYYKPHRSYLVNTAKIKSIDKKNLIINMVNGETCYVASRYLKGLMQKCLK